MDGGKIVIAGGTGLIGSALVAALGGRGFEIVRLVRRAASSTAPNVRDVLWEGKGSGPWTSELDGASGVINLAGRSVACRWDARNRRQILDSRVESTRAIAHAIGAASKAPAVWVNASATGVYGDRGDEELDEASKPGSGFLADVCVAWERELFSPSLPTRRVAVRTGVVLSRDGGVLPPLLRLARLYLGGRIGSGNQWWSAIHIADLVRVYIAALDGPLKGPLVATMPKPERNAEFMMILRHLAGRDFGVPTPAFVLRAVGETVGPNAAMALSSARTIPRGALAAGVEFRYPDVDSALAALLR